MGVTFEAGAGITTAEGIVSLASFERWLCASTAAPSTAAVAPTAANSSCSLESLDVDVPMGDEVLGSGYPRRVLAAQAAIVHEFYRGKPSCRN